VRGYGAHGTLDVGHVGLAVLVQRRGHAEQHGVGFGDAAKVGGGVAQFRGRQFLHHRLAEVFDIGAAGLDGIDLVAVDIEPEHGHLLLVEGPHERQAHIAEADDSDGVGAVPDFFKQGVHARVSCCVARHELLVDHIEVTG